MAQSLHSMVRDYAKLVGFYGFVRQDLEAEFDINANHARSIISRLIGEGSVVVATNRQTRKPYYLHVDAEENPDRLEHLRKQIEVSQRFGGVL